MARSPELARLFLQPHGPAQRHYEICRAYFSHGTTAERLADDFHLHVDTVRAIVRDFARDPDVDSFFAAPARPGREAAPKRAAISERAGSLRRQGPSLAGIRAALRQEGGDVSESYLFRAPHRAGLTATRHHRSPPRPGESARDGSVVPEIADIHELSLGDGRRFPTRVAGLFLSLPLPLLLELDPPRAVDLAGPPGSEPIPPVQAPLASLAPKLLGKRRVGHISDLCCDEGAGLFAGLNVLPKATYATDYSYKTERAMTERLIAAVVARAPSGEAPLSFNLDFRAIPSRGDEPDLESHWVAMRNRAGPAVMALVAQAAPRRVIRYATANVIRAGADSLVPRSADYWKEQTGQYPARLLFDSRATTYAGLNQPTRRGVGFITIRRRGSALLARAAHLPADRWGSCQIAQAKGRRRRVQYVDESIELDGYEGAARRGAATDRDGTGSRIADVLPDQRPAASADRPGGDPGLCQPESCRESPR